MARTMIKSTRRATPHETRIFMALVQSSATRFCPQLDLRHHRADALGRFRVGEHRFRSLDGEPRGLPRRSLKPMTLAAPTKLSLDRKSLTQASDHNCRGVPHHAELGLDIRQVAADQSMGRC